MGWSTSLWPWPEDFSAPFFTSCNNYEETSCGTRPTPMRTSSSSFFTSCNSEDQRTSFSPTTTRASSSSSFFSSSPGRGGAGGSRGSGRASARTPPSASLPSTTTTSSRFSTSFFYPTREKPAPAPHFESFNTLGPDPLSDFPPPPGGEKQSEGVLKTIRGEELVKSQDSAFKRDDSKLVWGWSQARNPSDQYVTHSDVFTLDNTCFSGSRRCPVTVNGEMTPADGKGVASTVGGGATDGAASSFQLRKHPFFDQDENERRLHPAFTFKKALYGPVRVTVREVGFLSLGGSNPSVATIRRKLSNVEGWKHQYSKTATAVANGDDPKAPVVHWKQVYMIGRLDLQSWNEAVYRKIILPHRRARFPDDKLAAHPQQILEFFDGNEDDGEAFPVKDASSGSKMFDFFFGSWGVAPASKKPVGSSTSGTSGTPAFESRPPPLSHHNRAFLKGDEFYVVNSMSEM
ncbi:unnamed protein product [Amoebophrya sp. A25]|nr:unnamed protein product [Amoebophrya sp. A25]|eukprot:GSA25T00003608001.1